MSAPEPLTPTQFQLMAVVWDLADQVPAVSAWDVNHAAGERHGYRGHPTILRLLKLLVEKGYLSHDPEAGERGGLYRVAVEREAGARLFLDRLIEPLGDDLRLLRLLENRLRDRLEAAAAAAHAV